MHKDDLEILVNSMPAHETPPDFAIKLLEDTCARSGLDWKMRHVYLMKRGGKWGVTLSIDGFRLIGSQDPEYAGQEGPFWVVSPESTWTDIPPDGPIYAAKVGVKHRSGAITWGVAKFKDYAAGPMWNKFPSTMSAKCAEMLAWRKAMPGRLGGLYGTEEMEQAGFGPKAGKVQPVAGEASAPDDAGPKGFYLSALRTAKSLDEVKGIGRDAQGDKALNEDSLLEIHEVYTEMKGKYA